MVVPVALLLVTYCIEKCGERLVGEQSTISIINMIIKLFFEVATTERSAEDSVAKH
jgi:hypothetical protein